MCEKVLNNIALSSPEEQIHATPLDRQIVCEGLRLDVLGDPGDFSDCRVAFLVDPYGG